MQPEGASHRTSLASRNGVKSKRAGPPRAAIARPFDQDILRRAEQIARHYRVMLEHDDDAGWVGSGVELPTVFGGGKTPDECVENTREALVAAVAHMLELGQHPPESSARTLQVNIRLTPEEKLVLTNTAHRVGFQGLSDFVRSVALEHAQRQP